ncbi:MAG: hypothetical protein ABGW77_05250 [Campylobacterales bacterium]
MEENFQLVVEEIFPIYWRRLEERGLFDDLDPILEGLKLELHRGMENYYGIFYDKAQHLIRVSYPALKGGASCFTGR